MYAIKEVSTIIETVKSEIHQPESFIHKILIDSRKIISPKTSVFIALKSRRDGHDFIADAYQAGVRNFILTDIAFQTSAFPGANFLWVSDALAALQALAKAKRSQFSGKVIAITGSNGKTIVKEWLYQLLSPDFIIQRSPKSYNSQIGVALSLWELQEDAQLAIIEAGISEVGEMQKLADMIQPQIGILTNIGIAHQSGFQSKQQKIAEKMRLFQQADILIYPHKYISSTELPLGINSFSWGQQASDSLYVRYEEKKAAGFTAVGLSFQGQDFEVEIPFVDLAAVENSISCIATMLQLNYDIEIIQERMLKLQAVEMRLQLKKGLRNCSIIDDSYSNDLAALQIALDFLNQQNQHERKTLILSDIPSLDLKDSKYTDKLTSLINGNKLYRLILIGKELVQISSLFQTQVYSFPSTEAFIQGYADLAFNNETILLKGARNFQFEEISKILTAKSHDTVLEINLNAIEYNLNKYKSLLPQDVKMMAMVKAFSYGSGSYEIANILQFNKIDYLAVAFVDEGVELRQGGIKLPIMVMSPDENAFESLLAYQLEPEIYSFRILRAFCEFLQAKGIQDYPIHIKVDTGMHRLGFLPSELQELSAYLKAHQTLQVKSCFSHLAAASALAHKAFTEQQIHIFDSFTTGLKEALAYPFIRHIAATSGIANWPSAYFDMVRLGIGLYGIELDREDLVLQETSVLKTNVTQIKTLPSTETVGYGRMGKLDKESKIATLKIGYADGYSRQFGNGVGKMMVNGYLAPTVGNICMDMCMIDVTDIPVQEEDEVIVFPDLIAAADSIGTIPYELLVNISQRVKRVYFYE